MTTLAVPPESVTPPGAPGSGVALDPPTGPPVQLAHVFADLMPDEIVARRRLAHLKPRLGFALVALALLLVLGFALAWVQTRNADADLASERTRAALLNSQVSRYSRLVTVQNGTAQIRTELAGVMTGDLPWGRLLGTVQSKAPAGVTVTGVDGNVLGALGSDSSDSQADTGVTLNPTSDAVAGSLSVTGTAPRLDSVATLLTALERVPGLVAAEPATTTAGQHGLDFTIKLAITTKALGGRFASGATSGTTGTSGVTGTGGN